MQSRSPDLLPDMSGCLALKALEGKALLVLDAAALPSELPLAPIRVVVDRGGSLPGLDPADFDILVTTRMNAPAPWVSVLPTRLDAQLARVQGVVDRSPIAASLLAQILRTGENLDFDAALTLESLAYSTLLGGEESAAWLAARVTGVAEPQSPAVVRYARDDDRVTLVLASPGNRNAMTAAMRDALYEGLSNIIDDPSHPTVVLRSEGDCFSTGGHLPEFGTAKDLARAHLIRTARSSARLLHRLGERAEAHVHGACIGSGIEIAAAAARRTAAPGTFVQLPEVAMGLIPGAGGTVSLARAIGRHRLLWLALGNFRVGAEQAMHWGLFDAITP